MMESYSSCFVCLDVTQCWLTGCSNFRVMMEKSIYISGCMEWHLIAYMIFLLAFIS